MPFLPLEFKYTSSPAGGFLVRQEEEDGAPRTTGTLLFSDGAFYLARVGDEVTGVSCKLSGLSVRQLLVLRHQIERLLRGDHFRAELEQLSASDWAAERRSGRVGDVEEMRSDIDRILAWTHPPADMPEGSADEIA